ncbi:glycosyltransferase family 2 protein, partial [Paralimibaculum aggregatum]|uniref:glycosyltransferase family 2 protein n=1 Tax=Paralimibaculum aggregatum TaxID=3036245 RepID=UPI0025534753
MTVITRVVVAYNSAAALRWQAASSQSLPTVLVDNASPDDSASVGAELGYRVIRLPANKGFGRGVMAGLAAVETELALVVNPDVAVDAAAVAALAAAAAEFPDCDLFVPKLVDEDGEVFFRHESSLEPRLSRRDVPEGTACIPMISGAAMLVRVRGFLDFGGFDPAIFLYFEDDDLALRYRAARRPIIFVPAARVLHLGDRSSGGDPSASRIKDRSFGWSRAYLMAKHRRGWRLLTLAGMIAKLPVYAVA